MQTKSITADNIPDTQKGKNCEDEKTDCSTPFCSPERESAAGKANQLMDGKDKETQDQEQQEPGNESSVSVSASVSVSVSSSGGNRKPRKEYSEEDYKNWPMDKIKEPVGNDVLYGRGGGTNHHEGNKRYRKMVELRKVDYVNSKRLDKPLVALDIIRQWRDQKPPGRFLKLDEATGLWSDVGDKKAREKTSQALREKAPLLRKQQEEMLRENAPIALNGEIDPSSSYPTETKATRFNIPQNTGKVSKNLSRALLARDHSLGRDFVAADEPVSIKGFSWDAADNAVDEDASDEPPPLPQPNTWHEYSRHEKSHHQQQYSLGGSYRPSPPGSASPPVAMPMTPSPHDRQHSLSVNPLQGASTHIQATNSFGESVSGGGSGGGYPHSHSHSNPHTPIGGGRSGHSSGPSSSHWSQHPGYPQPSPPRSDERLQAEWTKSRYGSGDNDADYRQARSTECDYRSHSSQWHHNSSHERVHSDDYSNRFSHGPSPDNGYNMQQQQQQQQQRYDGYNNNNNMNNNNGYRYQDNNPMQPTGGTYNQHGGMQWNSPSRSPGSMSYSNQPQGPTSNFNTNSFMSGGYNNSSGPTNSGYGGGYMDASTNRNLVMDGGGNSSCSISNGLMNRMMADSMNMDSLSGGSNSPSRSSLPRPQNIKRDTSHQCENNETKSHVKRMNRQRSIGVVSDLDMKNLRTHMRQSSIGQDESIHPLKRPSSIRMNDRVPTIDGFPLGIDSASSPLDDTNGKLLDRPTPLGGGHRGSSVASIKIEDIAGLINKPSSLNSNDRGSTLGSLDPELLHHVEI